MEITIKGSPKEIAELATAIAKPAENETNSGVFDKQLELLSKVSEYCAHREHLFEQLPALTQAMTALRNHARQTN